MLKIGHYVERPGLKPKDAPVTIPVAEELESVPGIPQNPADVDWYSREYPEETQQVEYTADREWANTVLTPEAKEFKELHEKVMEPIYKRIRVSGDIEPTAQPTGEDVTEKIKAKAQELGYREVGIVKYDHRYTYKSVKHFVKYEHAICLMMEQDYEQTQSAPSMDAEHGHFGTYEMQGIAGQRLADYVRSLGYHAQIHGPSNHNAVTIPMFVEAGLGQLGANGQLLSPHFGSRGRLQLITTDAKVTYDKPVDYGIHRFCQVCQVCVNRCPGRALQREKVWWRGVEKNKLTYKRCAPVMFRYEGCAVCMRVCPIQKYGMKAVMEHYVDTGEVLGKGTHELEGYEMRGKGYFGPGQLPTFDNQFFQIPHGRTEDMLFEDFKAELIDGELPSGSDGIRILEEFKANVKHALDEAARATNPMD